MAYVSLTDGERATGKGQPGEGAAAEPHGGPRALARTRGIVAALSTVTQRVRAQRAGRATSDTRWEADGLAEKLADGSTKVNVRTAAEKTAGEGGRGWWNDGPLPPRAQWERFRAWLDAAEHPAVRVLVVLFGLPVTVVGIVMSALVKVTQHPGGMIVVTCVLGIWWGATLADAPPVPPAAGGTP